ncbi:MAG: FkbM family methyltransferase [Gammaproteobacteria bacterium]|nr:FkbM family methyltransferase [Gammaproteobacteria bacterium]
MQIPNTFKSIANSLLPPGAFQWLRKRHLVNDLPNIRLKDEPDLAYLESVLKPGCVAFDVGANAGLYSHWFSRWAGINGRVFAFEPIPATYDLLNAIKNKYELSNLVIYQLSLSDKADSVTMHIPTTDQKSLPNYYQAAIDKPDEQRLVKQVSLPTDTLDSIVSAMQFSSLDITKFDVEDHELAWLRGAREVIAKFKPLLLIEISGAMNEEHSSACQ